MDDGRTMFWWMRVSLVFSNTRIVTHGMQKLKDKDGNIVRMNHAWTDISRSIFVVVQ